MGEQVTISGVLEIPAPKRRYYLNPSPVIPSIANYTIAKLPLTPSGSSSAVPRLSGNLIALEGEETLTDYVFIEKDDQGDTIQGSFRVLNVNIAGSVKAELTVTLSITDIDDNPPETNKPSIEYSQNEDEPVIIKVTNADRYDNYGTDGIKWYISGIYKDEGESFTLDISAIEYKIVGVYTITVEAAIDGVSYSAVITVKVTPWK